MSITSSRNRRSYVSTIVGLGLLTAIVVVLQYLSMAIRFGAFSVTLALMPIVIGAALYGVWAGAWLGFVFGVIVLASGDAAPFMAINIPGMIITVLLKGILSGFCAGLVYKLIPKGLNFDRNTVTITDILLIAGGIILALVGFLTKPKLEAEQEKFRHYHSCHRHLFPCLSSCKKAQDVYVRCRVRRSCCFSHS